MIDLECSVCKHAFQRKIYEYNRMVKKGWKPCCSRQCGSFLAKRVGRKDFDPANRKDRFSAFRWFLLSSVSRRKNNSKLENNLTLEYLENLWIKQKGICPLTGWKLILPKNSNQWNEGNTIYRASLDRIDSAKGYLKENVRFISIIANYAKNNFTDQEVFLFCKAVMDRWSSIPPSPI